MKREDIINAYCRIRTIDHTIPDDVLDFMKNSALEKLDSVTHNVNSSCSDCKFGIPEWEYVCWHCAGKSMFYPKV